MGCLQIHFDVAIVDSYSVEPEPQTVTLLKTSMVHILNEDPCSAPLNICVDRIVKCQKGCAFDVIKHDFPIDPCDPILPPGEYEICVPQSFSALENAVVGMDVVFEEVSAEYVQAIIANKVGGC